VSSTCKTGMQLVMLGVKYIAPLHVVVFDDVMKKMISISGVNLHACIHRAHSGAKSRM
jgi:hypothetical protein